MARADKRPHDDLRQRQSQQVERISEIAADIAITDHVAEANPHDQYVLEASTDASPYGFVADEDDMASDSALLLATQQSIKAYVDAQAAAATREVLLDGDGNPVFNGQGDWLYVEVTYG